MNPMLDQALNYAQEHFKIFPLKVNSKSEQILKSWKKEATDDLHQVQTWWREYPNANIGVKTGNGFIVIVVANDNERNGKEIMESYIEKFPKTKIVRTPNDDWHFYYYVDRDIPCHIDLYEGIDIQGEGGYVVGAGSQIDGRKYFVSLDVPIAKANEEVYKFLEGHLEVKDKNYCYNPILVGQRNDVLFKMGCFMQAKGFCDEAIRSALLNENNYHCEIPINEKEVESILKSISKRYNKGSTKENGSLYENEYFNVVEELKHDIEDEPEIVENLIPIGATLLGAPQKIGKTFFALQLSNAIASGQEFLGNKVQQGHVFYIALEDSKAKILKRFRRFNIEISKKLNVKKVKPFDPLFNIEEEIQREIQRHSDLKMVVIDTFPKIRKNTKVDYQMEYEELSYYHDLGLKYGIAIILVLHVRKIIDRNAPFDNIYGSRGVTAAADAMIVMLNHYTFPKYKEVFVTGKDIPENQFILSQNENLLFFLEDDTLNENMIDENIIRVIHYVVSKKEYTGTHQDLCAKLSLPISAKKLQCLLKANKSVLQENFIKYENLQKVTKARPIKLTYSGNEQI